MNPNNNANITLFCPSGHRLRGGTELMGKRVTCPRCKIQFVFASAASESRPAGANLSAAASKRTVSESGVMAILGQMKTNAPPRSQRAPEGRTCPKCDSALTDSLAFCPSCRTYLSVMPTFMRQMFDR